VASSGTISGGGDDDQLIDGDLPVGLRLQLTSGRSATSHQVPAVSSPSAPSILAYTFEGKQCRTLFNTETGEVYVGLADLLKATGSATNPARVIPALKEIFGKGGVIVTPLQTPGGIQNVTFVLEHVGMFVISRMQTVASKRLNRRLFGEVIPSIKKTGMYAVSPAAIAENLLANPGSPDRVDHRAQDRAGEAGAGRRRPTQSDRGEGSECPRRRRWKSPENAKDARWRRFEGVLVQFPGPFPAFARIVGGGKQQAERL
jgi:prophage antirepressor-like protein